MRIHSIERVLPIAVLSLGVLISGALVASAQTPTAPQVSVPASITYPIPELGNCTDQANCRTYCNDTAHMTACLNFAEAHKMMSANDLANARKLSALATNGGPGGCKTKDQCEAYCETTDHLSECLAFAERSGFVPQDVLKEMKSIHAALKDGANLPGGCKTKNECATYCADPAHMEQCVAFAERSGMLSGRDLDEAKKVMPYVTRGETPGACKTKDECQNYCADSAHTLECVTFAEKVGFVSKEEADIVRKTGGKGPGNCASKESCDTYCNAKEHQDECFAFAEQHGLVKPEELKMIKEGTARLRMGLSQFPQEVVRCLKDKLGADAVGRIESGQMTPDRELGNTVQACFNEFKPKMQSKIQEGLKYAPPEVVSCLQSGLGAADFEQMKLGNIDTPEKGDVVKSCFEKMKGAIQEQMKQGASRMGQLPEQARACVKQKLGSDIFDKLQSGDTEALKGSASDIQAAIGGCMSQFKPVGMPTTNGAPGGAPDPEAIKKMMEGGQIPEQYKKMMEGGGYAPGNTPPIIPQNGPTPEQLKQMMPQIPQGGPTPEQIQQMMRQGIPGGIPQGYPQPPQ